MIFEKDLLVYVFVYVFAFRLVVIEFYTMRSVGILKVLATQKKNFVIVQVFPLHEQNHELFRAFFSFVSFKGMQ